MGDQPNVLIERWFPAETIGAECMRERGASSALPPLYFLHIWWARKPLVACRATILASVLPPWSPDWPDTLRAQFPSEAAYSQWFLRACGILGDPVAGRRLITWAKDNGTTLASSPYSHPRAFTVNPSQDVTQTIGDLIELVWGKRELAVLDPFAGGGSIPFEASRYGFRTTANELNPVATVILRATLQYPMVYGSSLSQDIDRFGKRLTDLVRERLAQYYPKSEDERVHAYLWARTV